MKKYKVYVKNNYFYLEDFYTGEIWVSFKKEVQIDPSNDGALAYRIFNLKDWDSKIPLCLPQLLKEDGTPFTEEEWKDFYTENTGNYGDGGAAEMVDLLADIKDELILIKEEALNDDSYQLFEDTDGNAIFGKIDNEGVLKFYKADGSEYTGDVKPYSREVQQTITDYCADSVPYSLIQLRDADTKEVIVSIWRNDNDLTEGSTAPVNVTKGVCVVADTTGKDCTTPMFSNVCNHEEISQPIVDKIQELIDSNNQNSIDEQALLTTIKEKIEALTVVITDFKAENNANLLSVIAKLELQLAELVLIKDKIEAGNVILADIKVEIETINTNLTTINNTLVEKFGVVNTKLDSVISGLSTINTTLQTEFDQTQEKLDDVISAIELKGSDCANAVYTKDCDRQALLDALGEIKDAVTAGSIDYTAILNSIDSKLDALENVVTELQTANATLTNIENETTEINTNLTTLIEKATDQITELQGIKGELVAGNLKLDEIVLKLTNIDTNITAIKTDISAIKTAVESIDAKLDDVVNSLTNLETLVENSNTLLQSLLDELNVSIEIESYEKNNGTINYLQKDTILWDNESGTQISKTTEYSINGIDWTTTAPAGDVNLGFLVPPANNFAQDTFQLTDCEGTPIGVEEQVIKVVQLAKQTAKICNTEDITTPITDAIAQNKTIQKGKKQDLLTWVAVANDELIIPAKFTTMALLAAKGEFTISNETNNFSADLNITGGTILNKIEISADGVGTESGATDTPNTIDTRSTFDMDTLSNSFLVKCVRDGVLKLELYKI